MQADVVIIGGGMIGASIAWWTARDPGFRGRIVVVERDPTYALASTSHTNSCIRQQFGTELNIRISQFGVEFVKNFARYVDDPDAPDLPIHAFGYLYLAADDRFARVLRENQALQARLGAGTILLTPDEIAARWPFYALDDVVLGSWGARDEGYFDGGTIFDWMRRKGRALGVEYLADEVTGLDLAGGRVAHVRLASGRRIAAGQVVNAAGPAAARVAAMAGIALPVEPRKRFTFVFEAEDDLGRDLPLTIDPSGVHMRQDGRWFMGGCPPDDDGPVAADDFGMDPGIWQDKVWPAIATRVPAFERVRVRNEWVGHYAYNTLDQNAVLGPHPEIGNLLFANGFSGHGLQQSPAVGRGIAECLVHGGYRSLDLSPLGFDRVAENRPLVERAVI